MATTSVVLLVIYFTSVHAGLITTAWGILEQVNPRFVEEDMCDPSLNWYMGYCEDEFKTVSPTQTFLVEEFGFSIYGIRVRDGWDEAVVRQSIDCCPGFIEHCLLKEPVGIRITTKTDPTFDPATSSGSPGNQLLIIGVSQAFIRTDEDSISWSNELRDYFHIQNIDREAQNWANVYSTNGANSGKKRENLEILNCISGIEIILLPTVKTYEYNNTCLVLAKQVARTSRKQICAVGWDVGRVVDTLGQKPQLVSNNLYYITIVVRTGVPSQGISYLSEMPFWKTMTISRSFLYTVAPPSTPSVLERRKELERLFLRACRLNTKYEGLVLLADDGQEAAMKAVHRGNYSVYPQYIAISKTFNVDVTIGYAILVLSSKVSNEELKACGMANTAGATGDNSAVIEFGIFWDYIPITEKFKLTVALRGEAGKT